VIRCRNGDVLRLAPDGPEIVDEIPAGRLYKDGALLIPAEGKTVSQRRKLSFAGIVFVAIAVTEKGILAADPEIDMMGIPERGRDGSDLYEIAYDAAVTTVETLPKPRRRDPDSVAESVRRAVRAALAAQWGKKPACHVHVLVV
jgi:ribonuclease J